MTNLNRMNDLQFCEFYIISPPILYTYLVNTDIRIEDDHFLRTWHLQCIDHKKVPQSLLTITRIESIRSQHFWKFFSEYQSLTEHGNARGNSQGSYHSAVQHHYRYLRINDFAMSKTLDDRARIAAFVARTVAVMQVHEITNQSIDIIIQTKKGLTAILALSKKARYICISLLRYSENKVI